VALTTASTGGVVVLVRNTCLIFVVFDFILSSGVVVVSPCCRC